MTVYKLETIEGRLVKYEDKNNNNKLDNGEKSAATFVFSKSRGSNVYDLVKAYGDTSLFTVEELKTALNDDKYENKDENNKKSYLVSNGKIISNPTLNKKYDVGELRAALDETKPETVENQPRFVSSSENKTSDSQPASSSDLNPGGFSFGNFMGGMGGGLEGIISAVSNLAAEILGRLSAALKNISDMTFTNQGSSSSLNLDSSLDFGSNTCCVTSSTEPEDNTPSSGSSPRPTNAADGATASNTTEESSEETAENQTGEDTEPKYLGSVTVGSKRYFIKKDSKNKITVFLEGKQVKAENKNGIITIKDNNNKVLLTIKQNITSWKGQETVGIQVTGFNNKAEEDSKTFYSLDGNIVDCLYKNVNANYFNKRYVMTKDDEGIAQRANYIRYSASSDRWVKTGLEAPQSIDYKCDSTDLTISRMTDEDGTPTKNPVFMVMEGNCPKTTEYLSDGTTRYNWWGTGYIDIKENSDRKSIIVTKMNGVTGTKYSEHEYYPDGSHDERIYNGNVYSLTEFNSRNEQVGQPRSISPPPPRIKSSESTRQLSR